MIMIRDFSNMFQQMSGMPINSKVTLIPRLLRM